MRMEKNDAGERLFERNPERVPYETSFMHVSHAERSPPLSIEEDLWLAWQLGDPIPDSRDVGPWFCVPPFRMVCLFQDTTVLRAE